MKVVCIGAGRVATHLAPALHRSGAEVVEVWSRTQASAELLARRLQCKAVWGSLDVVSTDADLYVLCVTDAALAEVVRRLHVGREQALFVHTAGSMPLGLFADSGHTRGGVFYPMQTFSLEREVDFASVHFFLETSVATDFPLLMQLAERLTPAANIHSSTSALRRRLHLAAVFACNFANHCCTLADDLLAETGLDFSILLPLVDETVAKLHQLPPRDAQTGPAARNDENVMGIHRAMLADRPDMQNLYSLLSKSIQRYD